MQRWTNFFDAIYLINLQDNNGRLRNSVFELHKYGIPVQVFDATYDIEGAVGLRQTMIRLFSESLSRGYEKIMVLEDDFRVIDDINLYMPLCLEQLPVNFDLLYLGGYIVSPFKKRYSENLLLLDKILTTHAVCYSQNVIKSMLNLFSKHHENIRDKTTIDMLLLNRVQTLGNSYISYPLLISQISGYSQIQGKEVDYEKYIEKEYAKHYEQLNSQT